MAGDSTSTGCVNRYFFALTTISPQLAVGGCAPTPRKLSELSESIADGMLKVNNTTKVGMQFGNICLKIIVALETPILLAASTYSFFDSESVSERTTLDVDAQLTNDNAINIFISPPPIVYITTIARRSEGNASIISASLIIAKSILPPK